MVDVELAVGGMDDLAEIYLDDAERLEYGSLPPATRYEYLRALLTEPIRDFSVVNRAFFYARWGELIKTLYGNEAVSLLEVATGAEDMIPRSVSRILPDSTYVTANVNEKLSNSFLAKTKDLPIRIELIRDDAANLDKYLDGGSLDIVAFQHGVNDVLQAILCDQNGIDTADADWMALLPRMIELVTDFHEKGTFEELTKGAFLGMVDTLTGFLKPGGHVIMNHYMFQYDLDLGYPYHIWENLIPIVRTWLSEVSGLREITVPDYPRQWWLILQNN